MLELYKESQDAREKGVRYVIASGASFFIRRGGMAQWKLAVKDATDEVLGASYSFNTIDESSDEKIIAKAVANYLVAGWEDLKDENGNCLPYSLSASRNMFEAEGLPYHSLAMELLEASLQHERFLEKVVLEDADYLKK